MPPVVGASVLLLEQGDLAGATSSASSKLIHGGLRYLEHYKFGLVREALAEREVLWRIAPHLISPLALRDAASARHAAKMDAAGRAVPLRYAGAAPLCSRARAGSICVRRRRART